MRRASCWLACSVVATSLFLLAPAASAHHFLGTCEEVGEYNSSASARMGEFIYSESVLAYVGWIPPMAGCLNPYRQNEYAPNQPASQHTALHAKRVGPTTGFEYCLETVAQRISGGWLRMWGYNCGRQPPGEPYQTPNIMDIGYYGSDWMYLWQVSNGGPNWYHYFYRYDINQWAYLGVTPQGACCSYYQSWLESSGYNETSTRGTHFVNFYEERWGGGAGTSNFPCPVERDWDRHQEEIPNAGGQAANTSWMPATTHSC